MQIELGALAPALKDQPEVAACFPADRLAIWQRRFDAATMLHVCGFSVESETNKIRNRILKAMGREASSGSVTTSGASTAPETTKET